MRRAVGLFLSLWAVSAAGLITQAYLSTTPLQRYYWRAEAEAELGAHVRIPSLNISQLAAEPSVAVVLRDGGGAWRWFALPATEVRRDLAAVFPAPLLSGLLWLPAIAAGEALVLYGIVLGLARSIAAREHRTYPAPSGR
ncbi:MAG TPA: hypothetical protein VFL28_07320 [bacterium]|nr:hypothetical protein [bacterium]